MATPTITITIDPQRGACLHHNLQTPAQALELLLDAAKGLARQELAKHAAADETPRIAIATVLPTLRA